MHLYLPSIPPSNNIEKEEYRDDAHDPPITHDVVYVFSRVALSVDAMLLGSHHTLLVTCNLNN